MVKRLFYFFAALLLEVPLLRAQIDLQRSNSLLYAPLSLYVQGEQRIVNALIDTGCSLCMIDSTYAVDSCAWDGVREDSLWVTGAEGDGARLSRIVLDSLSIAGQCYRKVPCVVMNLRERLRHHAPNFLLGADILRRERWQFDLKRYRLKRMVGAPPKPLYRLAWKRRAGKETQWLGIYFKGKLKGRKVHFFLDTGSRWNWIPRSWGVPPSYAVERESAHLTKSLVMETKEVCSAVPFQLGEQTYFFDFSLRDGEIGVLNADFLDQHVFFLDYKRRRLEVLE